MWSLCIGVGGLSEGGGWGGGGGVTVETGPEGQEVVDKSRGRDGGLGQGREVKEDCHRNDVRDKAIIP